MKFHIKTPNRNIADEALIDDVITVAKKIERNTVTMDDYELHGQYHPTTLTRRFGSWFKVLENAGLKRSRSELNISEEKLFQNIEDMWIQLGRQPKYAEVKKPFSKYAAGTYDKRFGSWLKALEKFVEFANQDSDSSEEVNQNEVTKTTNIEKNATRKTRRRVSKRLRFKILERDNFTCQSCGASPATTLGVKLHVDHVIPLSKGGENEETNLQAKCEDCNRGKGNAFNR